MAQVFVGEVADYVLVARGRGEEGGTKLYPMYVLMRDISSNSAGRGGKREERWSFSRSIYTPCTHIHTHTHTHHSPSTYNPPPLHNPHTYNPPPPTQPPHTHTKVHPTWASCSVEYSQEQILKSALPLTEERRKKSYLCFIALQHYLHCKRLCSQAFQFRFQFLITWSFFFRILCHQKLKLGKTCGQGYTHFVLSVSKLVSV